MLSLVARDPGIYVEILIRGSIDEVWRHTQEPSIHELWDLRFSAIRYLPRPAESEPQRFLYSTRLGFGLHIDGEGESTGSREDAGGIRTSALKFWSRDPKSLIEHGSGYWRYVPARDGTRFLTWYDYQPRFGVLGRILDRLVFRPWIGWATAWSFDRLRLWIDEGITPAASLKFTLIHGVARLGIAFIWVWQGLVPKLLHRDADERAMMAAAGLPADLIPVIGLIEILFALVGLWLWRWRSYFLLNIVAMIVAASLVALRSPAYITAAFNPITLNAGVAFLSIAGYLAASSLATASRCLRRQLAERK
ncbi:MAG TPA: DoxX-like family protein [Bryobacteraceae bacterium]|jgi:hypothetical protein|nr:DoxX-like family protein [Bryobacteraceae bacterium]